MFTKSFLVDFNYKNNKNTFESVLLRYYFNHVDFKDLFLSTWFKLPQVIQETCKVLKVDTGYRNVTMYFDKTDENYNTLLNYCDNEFVISIESDNTYYKIVMGA